EPNNNHDDTVMSHGGSNTLDITQAYLPTNGDQKPGATVPRIGATIDMNLVAGQRQIIYNSAALDRNIGSLVDPGFLASNSTASLTIEGTIQTVVAGSGNTLFAAPATGSGTTQEPGTSIVLVGSGNKVFGAQGVTVLAFSGGNQVSQSLDPASAGA